MAKQFSVDDKIFKRDLKKVKKYLDRTFPKQVLADFKENTPVAKAPPAGTVGGNARRNTKLKNRFGGKEIVADYPYSGVIDKGLYPKSPKGGFNKTQGGYSKQAPKGIVDPTLKQAEKHFDNFLRKL